MCQQSDEGPFLCFLCFNETMPLCTKPGPYRNYFPSSVWKNLVGLLELWSKCSWGWMEANPRFNMRWKGWNQKQILCVVFEWLVQQSHMAAVFRFPHTFGHVVGSGIRLLGQIQRLLTVACGPYINVGKVGQKNYYLWSLMIISGKSGESRKCKRIPTFVSILLPVFQLRYRMSPLSPGNMKTWWPSWPPATSTPALLAASPTADPGLSTVSCWRKRWEMDGWMGGGAYSI